MTSKKWQGLPFQWCLLSTEKDSYKGFPPAKRDRDGRWGREGEGVRARRERGKKGGRKETNGGLGRAVWQRAELLGTPASPMECLGSGSVHFRSSWICQAAHGSPKCLDSCHGPILLATAWSSPEPDIVNICKTPVNPLMGALPPSRGHVAFQINTFL